MVVGEGKEVPCYRLEREMVFNNALVFKYIKVLVSSQRCYARTRARRRL